MQVQMGHDDLPHNRMAAVLRRDGRDLVLCGGRHSKILCLGDIVPLLFSPEGHQSLVEAMNKTHDDGRVIALGNECGRDVLFVPKIVRKPIVRTWEDMNEDAIQNSGLLSFPLMRRRDNPPRTSICVSAASDSRDFIEIEMKCGK